jgi:hypothetical protein
MSAAFLALVLQLMFPAGFMAAEPGQARGFPIVICSAYGQSVVDWNVPAASGDHQKAPAKKGMASCPFAGHAVGSNAPAPVIVAAPVAFAPAAAPARAYAVSPGRGLAAPPPPAIGPPTAA